MSVVVVEGGAPLADDHGKSLFQGVMVGNGNQKKMKTMVAMRGNWCFSWHSGGGDTDKGKCVSRECGGGGGRGLIFHLI